MLIATMLTAACLGCGIELDPTVASPQDSLVAKLRTLFPPPPVEGDATHRAELGALKAIAAQQNDAVKALALGLQARHVAGPTRASNWAAHALGRRYTQAKLPASNALLRHIDMLSDQTIAAAQTAYAFRQAPALQHDGLSSYPSAIVYRSRMVANALNAVFEVQAKVSASVATDVFQAADNTAALTLISGANWPSDVAAANQLADAIWPLVANHLSVRILLAEAQAEVAAQALNTAALPQAVVASTFDIFNREQRAIATYLAPILMAPAPIGALEINAMLAAEENRSPIVSADAKAVDVMTFWAYISDAVGTWAQPETMPKLEQFLKQLRTEFEPFLQHARATYPVQRPAQKIAELKPLWVSLPNTSYPSAKVWLFQIQADVLANLDPSLQPALNRAMKALAENRILSGAHWPSDVAAAQQAALRMQDEVRSSKLFLQQRNVFMAELKAAQIQLK